MFGAEQANPHAEASGSSPGTRRSHSAGANGEHTKEQVKRHRPNLRFWDVDIADVQLHGMHGADIAGAALAQSTRPRGKIISPVDLLSLFEAELPSIVAPDADYRIPRLVNLTVRII